MLDMSICIKWWDKTAFFIQLETNVKTAVKIIFRYHLDQIVKC